MQLGEVEVPCHIGPRVGSDMSAYQIANASGVVRNVYDLRGQHVLFHVWASWCAPCLESMPSLKATLDKYSNKPLTVVGLNIDEDRQAAQRVVASHSLTWAQNYLGKESPLARQLAISSVPAYYLIGHDGKLVGSSSNWDQLQQMLESGLEK